MARLSSEIKTGRGGEAKAKQPVGCWVRHGGELFLSGEIGRKPMKGCSVQAGGVRRPLLAD